MQGKLSYIALFNDRDKLAALKQRLDTLGITPDLASYSQQDQGQALMALTRSFHLNLNAMSMLAFVVGLFIAYNGVRYSLMKRQRLLIQLLQQGLRTTRCDACPARRITIFGYLRIDHWVYFRLTTQPLVTTYGCYDARAALWCSLAAGHLAMALVSTGDRAHLSGSTCCLHAPVF